MEPLRMVGLLKRPQTRGKFKVVLIKQMSVDRKQPSSVAKNLWVNYKLGVHERVETNVKKCWKVVSREQDDLEKKDRGNMA